MKNSVDNSAIISRINDTNPIHYMNQKEFDRSLLRFGALLSILRNKRINQTMLLQVLIEDEDFRESFKLLSEIENEHTLIKNLVERFPILCKSKIIKNKIKEILNDGTRKTVL